MMNDRHTTVAGKSLAELESLTADLNASFVIDKTRPLTPAERKRWQRAKRGPGRPKIGRGAKVVSVSIESGLLVATDRLAKKRKVSRARLIAEGLNWVVGRTNDAASPPSPARARRRAA